VIGLGYVGLPVAVAFGRLQRVVGFDIETARIEELAKGTDRTGEVSPEELGQANIHFTSNPADLRAADFHIVAVPTPIDSAKRPELSALVSASRLVGSALKPGDIVVFESTVYPGVTEEVCLPELEAASGLRGGAHFTVGYSPERINPGDKVHTFASITKVVSGQDAATLEVVARTYEAVVTAGVYRAPDIRTAEAAKVIENTQRDLNIALMNELAIIFNHIGVDTQEVLAAAGTKWNFLPFQPGLVGGHCIGVDPYYLTHLAQRVGYHPEVILSGRRINDDMGKYVAQQVVKRLHRRHAAHHGKPVTVLGVTFKEDVPDLRNSKVFQLVRELEDFGFATQVADPLADPNETFWKYGVTLQPLDDLQPTAAVIITVGHRAFREGGWGLVRSLVGESTALVADVRGVLPPAALPAGWEYWRL